MHNFLPGGTQEVRLSLAYAEYARMCRVDNVRSSPLLMHARGVSFSLIWKQS